MIKEIFIKTIIRNKQEILKLRKREQDKDLKAPFQIFKEEFAKCFKKTTCNEFALAIF